MRNRTSKRVIVITAMALLAPIASAEPNTWTVLPTAEGECELQSRVYDAFDGYEPTKISVTILSHDILVNTKSTIDPTYRLTGIQVDQFTREPFDEVIKQTRARFSTKYAKLLDQFKRGKTADIALGYWPSWPQTELQHVEVDLMGFTDAYEGFVKCELPEELTSE